MDDRGSIESGEVRSSGSQNKTEKLTLRKARPTASKRAIEQAVVRDVAPRVLAKVGSSGPDSESSRDASPVLAAASPQAHQLMNCLLQNDVEGVRAFARSVESGELSLIEACQRIFIPVAESLGTMWCDDSVSFVDVTLALSRLQAMVQDFAAYRSTAASRPPKERRIMLARLPGEDHVFGLVVLGLYFDSAGWEVSGGSDIEAGDSLYRELCDHDYGVLGLSVGSQANSNALSKIIADVRKSSKNPDLKIAVGGAAIRADTSLCARAGADFFANDANEAIEKAEALVA